MRYMACLGAVAVAVLLAPGSAGAASDAVAATGGAATGGAVTVWDTSGKRDEPCTAVDVSNRRKLRGGCLVQVNSRDLEILVRTVVGDMRFGTCLYTYNMRIDGDGRTYLEDVRGGGPSPCNDIDGCYRKDIRPMRGQIEALAGGRLAHVVDACFDTCMGQFVGKLRLGLERVRGRWMQTADRALVGDSGYRIDGRWDIEERDFDIRPAGAGSAGDDAAGAWRLTGDPVSWPI